MIVVGYLSERGDTMDTSILSFPQKQFQLFMNPDAGREREREMQKIASSLLQSWALSVFFNSFNYKK